MLPDPLTNYEIQRQAKFKGHSLRYIICLITIRCVKYPKPEYRKEEYHGAVCYLRNDYLIYFDSFVAENMFDEKIRLLDNSYMIH